MGDAAAGGGRVFVDPKKSSSSQTITSGVNVVILLVVLVVIVLVGFVAYSIWSYKTNETSVETRGKELKCRQFTQKNQRYGRLYI